MSEKVTGNSNEKLSKLDNKEAQEQLDKLGEKLRLDAEKASERNSDDEATKARKSVETLAVSGKEHAPTDGEGKKQKEPVTRGIKKQTYRSTMNRVESKLPAYQRSFSKVINNNTVDKVSNVASKTVARPSGLLGGGLTAFVGLAIVTYYANNIGFELSGSEFLLLVAIGWVAGLVVEGLYKGIKRTISR